MRKHKHIDLPTRKLNRLNARTPRSGRRRPAGRQRMKPTEVA
jgi:hypothetical protein